MTKQERRKIRNELRYQPGDLDEEKAWLDAREHARNVLLSLDLGGSPNFVDIEQMCELVLYLPERRREPCLVKDGCQRSDACGPCPPGYCERNGRL